MPRRWRGCSRTITANEPPHRSLSPPSLSSHLSVSVCLSVWWVGWLLRWMVGTVVNLLKAEVVAVVLGWEKRKNRRKDERKEHGIPLCEITHPITDKVLPHRGIPSWSPGVLLWVEGEGKDHKVCSTSVLSWAHPTPGGWWWGCVAVAVVCWRKPFFKYAKFPVLFILQLNFYCCFNF